MLNSDSHLQPRYPTACGGEVTNAEGYLSAEHRGRRYYFCLRACLRAFEAAPDDFMAGKIPHPLEEEPS
jgi:YHS domain-containing protein